MTFHGRVINLGGKLEVNFLIGAYHNLIKPTYGGDWLLRTQVTLIL
jgi:hypothetical protein